MNKVFTVVTLSTLITLGIVACGGGGGGGGGSSSEPAVGELSSDLATIEVGSQYNVGVKITEVTTNLAVKIRIPQVLNYEVESARLIAGNQSYDVGPTVNANLPSTSSSSSSSSSTSSASSSSSTSSSSSSSTSSSSSSSSSSSTSSSSTSTASKNSYVVLAGTGTVTPTPAPEVPKRMLVFYIPASLFVRDGSAELKFSLRAIGLVASGKIELDIDVDNPEVSNATEFSVSDPLFEAEDALSIRVKN